MCAGGDKLSKIKEPSSPLKHGNKMHSQSFLSTSLSGIISSTLYSLPHISMTVLQGGASTTGLSTTLVYFAEGKS